MVASGARVARASDAAAATSRSAISSPVFGRLGGSGKAEGAGVEVGTEFGTEFGTEALRFGGGFVPAFVLTWLIESIVYLLAFGSRGWLATGSGLTIGRTLLLVLGVNLATHPLLWWFTSSNAGIGPLVLAETVAVLIEGAIIGLALRERGRDAPDRWAWAFLAAVLANAVSLLVGLLALGPLLSFLGARGSSACC